MKNLFNAIIDLEILIILKHTMKAVLLCEDSLFLLLPFYQYVPTNRLNPFIFLSTLFLFFC